MDISNSSAGGAAVACPVCTLYLREGISLQRHLDTHPKEQVIEALIKASVGPVQSQQQHQAQLSPVPLSSPTVHSAASTPQLPHSAQLSTQSPYPIGPVFECPPIGTVMPPQFASFSYQQFVNNGTVMIPQYAMAPQSNQMMQMLYNPYGIYQQQQIPTVQMISPVTTIGGATGKVRTGSNLLSENNHPTASITVPVNNNEPKQILPEILPELEVDTDHVLPDVNGISPTASSSLHQTSRHLNDEGENMQAEQEPSQESRPTIEKFFAIERDYHPASKSLSINCDISNRTATPLIDHSRDVISIDNDNRTDGNDNEDDAGVEEDADDGDNDDGENNNIENHIRDENAQNRENDEVRAVSGAAQTVPLDVGDIKPVSISQLPDIHCKIIRQESSTPEDYLPIHKECSEQVVVSENSPNLSDFEIQEIKESDAKSFGNEKSLGTGVNSSKSHVSPTAKESIQPEAEQLEHLLIKIMQSELSCTSEKDHPDDQVDSNDKRWVKGISTVGTEGTDKSSTRTISKGNSCIETIEDEIEFKDCHSPYRYKHSLSAPASPYTQKKSYHTYSVRSEIGSLENLNSYPVGFHARILHNEHEDDDIDQQVQMEEDEEDDDENEEEEVATVEEDGDEIEDEEEDEDEDEDDDEDEEDDEDEDGDEDEESDDIIGIDIAPIVNDKLHVEEDNFDDADMEIAEIVSPHTPTIKCAESMDYGRSHTPLSASSGISVLRVRKDLSKPCSPASVHSFCNVDRNDMNSDEMIEIALSNASEDVSDDKKDESDYLGGEEASSKQNVFQDQVSPSQNIDKKFVSHVAYQQQSVITENINTFSALHSQQTTTTTTTTTALLNDSYPVGSSKIQNSLNLSDSLEGPDTDGGMETKSFHYTKTVVQKQSLELLNLNEDAHAGPMNVFEFDGLQILVPSAFINESSQKAVSATSQQSMPSSEGGVGIDEEVKSINMRADETMPARGELSEQESNGYTEQSAWQLYMGQESSRMSTSYDLMARESWEESEGSENEMNGPLLDSKSLATHFTSSLFLDRDRKTPTKRTFKCYHCSEVFDCPKERRVHSATVHKEAGPSSSSSREQVDQVEVKDIKLLDGRMNIFEDIFVPGLHVQQIYHHQQPLLHQLQPAQSSELNKLESEHKIDSLVVQSSVETTCTLCNQRFSSEVSLQLHQRRMHVTEKSKRVRESAKCQICNEMFPSVLLFNAHLKVHPLECSQCGKYFYRKQNFKLHMKRHLGIKPFPCTVCDKAFLTKQKLDEHTNGHTGNAPVKCNLCNETFRRYSNLTQHKNRHHLNIKKKLKDYICHCGEVFHTKKKLAWHKEIHDEKPKACTYCNERFIHMASLTRHMRRAHNRRFVPDAQRESENVECPICKCIYLRSSLAVHMRVHNGERPYECQVCSKAFSTKWNLQLHKWTHAARSAKPFKCNQCSAAFYRHSDYTAHMNSHRNVRPYTCNYCGAQFIRKYNCLRHVKEHEENKAYTCDVCNKTFHRSYYLKEHLRVHSGARPYTCHICGKSSGTKSNHNKHVRIHHAREPVNTEN